jgi:hypothetical protein
VTHLSVHNCRSDEHSVVKLEPRFPDRPAFDLVAIVDPVSRGAQKIAPVLEVLRQVLLRIPGIGSKESIPPAYVLIYLGNLKDDYPWPR